MKKSKFALFVESLLPSIVFAETVYLECDLDQDDNKPPLEISLDEASGNITHNYSTGSFNAKGFLVPKQFPIKADLEHLVM